MILTLLGKLDLQVQSPVRIVGICGQAGVGKDTVASFLQSTYKDVYQVAFAGKLKEICATAFNVTEDAFHEASLKGKPLEFWNTTPRAIAQFMGTEMFRTLVHPDFWIAHVVQELNKTQPVFDSEGTATDTCEYVYAKTDTVVISDVRFQNEYDWIIANRGIVIYLTRPDVSAPSGGIASHASEGTSLINLHTPERNFFIENDGTIPQLYHKVGKLFIDFLTPTN